MREDLNREKMHKAIDSAFSGLKGDPWLFQRVSARAVEGEIHVKKKMSIGVVLAIILILLAAAALAVTALMPHKEIVEQVAVPLALANDPRTGVNDHYSPADLAELVQVLYKNGIRLEENNSLIQRENALSAFSEEDTIRAICDQAFGDNWTLEEQDWFERILVQIGAKDAYTCMLPGPNNMTREEAESFAFKAIKEVCGQNLPLEDQKTWKLSCQFYPAVEENVKARWSFQLTPQDLEHGLYSVDFHEGDQCEQASVSMDVPDWTKPYTADRLLMQFNAVYSWKQNTWTQAVWKQFHEMMKQAELDPEDLFYTAYRGYQLTDYPEPNQNEIARDEAIWIAKEAFSNNVAVMDSAVLTEYAGERSWLVTMVIFPFDENMVDSHSGTWVVTIDSISGTVRSIRGIRDIGAYIPESALEKAKEGITEDNSGFIRMAAERIKKSYPDQNLLDEAAYSISVYGLYTHYVEFIPKSIQYGKFSAAILPEGETVIVYRDGSPLNSHNIFERYCTIYGYYANWDQERWIQLEKDAADLVDYPDFEDGPILKATHFPEESSVKVTRTQAQELAAHAASRETTARPHSCVLVDAQPHPVWIVRILTSGMINPIFGIDAETGETVFVDRYDVGGSQAYVAYSLPETREKVLGSYEQIPDPRPDGKPWCWGMEFAPKEYWDRAEAFMEANGITADPHLSVQEYEWEKSFGGMDFWPQEYRALFALFRISEENLKNPKFTFAKYPPFPDPDKKTQEDIIRAARSRIHELADESEGREWTDSLRAAVSLYNDSRNPDVKGENYGKPVWWVWLFEDTGNAEELGAMEAYAILDEDGNILTSGLGSI